MNRFTEQLLSIEVTSCGYCFWSDITEILGKFEKPMWWYREETEIDWLKATFVCLLAALDDNDLLECFGV